MADIRVLSPHVANLIAAGEVVERPASAAKELIENAVDAGADAITVEIKSGGIAYLRVTDNGCGIRREDVPTAFMRHSTSKIRSADDLAHIGTLGFRGEALAAIASVSKIDLMTKRRQDELGVSLHLQGGTAGKLESAGCPDGTTIVVRDLFFNTPARMKFLKRDAAEGAAVESVVQSAALSHPEISVKFIREGKQVLHTPGDSDLRSCIYSVFGRDTAMGMLKAESSLEQVSVRGFVSKPINARGNRMMQHFFVNGRPVKSRMLSVALDEAYKDSLMKGRYPACVIFIDMPLEQVDVNVHPAKTEVKFAREREIFDAVFFAAKSGLEKDSGRTEFKEPEKKPEPKPAAEAKPEPEIKVKPEPKPAAEVKPEPEIVKKPKPAACDMEVVVTGMEDVYMQETYIPMPEYEKSVAEVRKRINVDDYPTLKALWWSDPDEQAANIPPWAMAKVPGPKPEPAKPVEPIQQEIEVEKESFRVVGEVLDTYIIVEQGDSMLLIDKHAAHERIIFNRLKKSQAEPQSQLFIAPVIVTVTRAEAVALLEYREGLEKVGFEIDEFGEDSIAVRRVPDGISEGETPSVIGEIARELLDGKLPGSLEKLDAICHSVACKAAIKAGHKSGLRELEQIAGSVMSDPDVRYCPHGRPVTVEMTRYQLEKQFKRVT